MMLYSLQVRRVMESAMNNAVATVDSRPLDSGIAAMQKRHFVPQTVHDSVRRCTTHALAQLLLVVRNLGVLFNLAANAGEELASARRRGGQGMSLLWSLDHGAYQPVLPFYASYWLPRKLFIFII